MSLISLLLTLIIVFVIFWAVRALLSAFSIGEPISTVVMVLLVVIVIIWLVGAFTGHGVGTLRIT